ncbi:MAG: type II toxin-antitoxin system ParD family antitoxin [Planctomycetia bacterium]|nr:type II toxin-antitoxin system ParD family antitoxin [Planctomycetia bacterium]
MPSRNVNLTDHLDDFVAKQIDVGRYRNASEVMRAGLNLLEQKTEQDRRKLELLRALAKEGFDQVDQGQGIAFDNEDQLADYFAKLRRRVSKELKAGRRKG